jgi:DNA polymerase V
LRREKKYAQTIHFSVGYSKEYGGGIKKAHTLNRATNLTYYPKEVSFLKCVKDDSLAVGGR